MALRSDIVAAKALGLNTIRLHQKVNSARWYYWADVLVGVFVLQDMVQAFGVEISRDLFTQELQAMLRLSVEYDYSNNFRTNALLASGGRDNGSWAVQDEVLHFRYVLVNEVLTYLTLLVNEVLLVAHATSV